MKLNYGNDIKINDDIINIDLIDDTMQFIKKQPS